MNKNQIKQNILNYKNDITTLKNFIEAIRKMPTMYIGHVGNKGFLNMFREVFQNSIDELMKTEICDHIIVSYDERNNIIIIEDNGRGIPFDNIIRVFCSEHTSSNYNKKKGQYSSGRHGVGAKVTNALSSKFIVESYVLGKGRKVEFIEGEPWDKGEIEIENKNNLQGTRITFRPNYKIMGNITVTIEDIINMIKLILPLTKHGSTVYFNGINKFGKEYHEDIVNEDGLLTYLINKTTDPFIKPIFVSKDNGVMKADIIFTYDDISTLNDNNISTFSNFCPMMGGTHLDGFIDGICKFFRYYMNKIYLLNTNKKRKKDNKINIINKDIKDSGLVGIVSVCHLNPNFTGQAKEYLGNLEMKPFVSNLIYSKLKEWSKSNPKELDKLCKHFKNIAEIRIRNENDKIKLSKKNKSSITGFPHKFIIPTNMKSDKLEFIIVEGDSASGSARGSRNVETQGVLPIRGKLPNAMTTPRNKFLNNEEVYSICSIIGWTYGTKFDINKVKWDKVIIMTDADPDGAHISTLILKLFLEYMPDMIKYGKIYKAIPPLYGIEKRNIYFATRIDYIKYLENNFTKNNKISSIRGNILTKNEILNLLYINTDYTYELEKISKRYSIDPYVLETIIFSRYKGYNYLKNQINLIYRFLEVIKKKNTIIIRGIYNSNYQTIFLNNKFINDIKIIENIALKNDYKYNLNNIQVTLYTLMKKFELSCSNDIITRYKGLGEMDPDQLAKTTLYPSKNRRLIRYTFDDAIKEIDSIRYLESNRKELIKDIKATRTDLLG